MAEAFEIGVISKKEAELMRETEKARNDAIQVDSFTLQQYMSATPTAPSEIGEN